MFGNSSSTTLPDKASNTPLQDVYLLNGYVKVCLLFTNVRLQIGVIYNPTTAILGFIMISGGDAKRANDRT